MGIESVDRPGEPDSHFPNAWGDFAMVWYVALIAILNLGLGYGLGVFLRTGRLHPAAFRHEFRAALSSPTPANRLPNISFAEQLSDDAAADGSVPEFTSDAPAADAAKADAPAVETDPTTGLTTREHIEKSLAEMTATHVAAQPATVALVEITRGDNVNEAVEDRLLYGIAGTIRELLAEGHTAGRYTDQKFLLLLPQDDLQHATQRAEQVRQHVAATQYVADGQQIPATVTCALAQVTASQSATNLLEFLEETLEEAKRYGGNRTFMHDGTSPAPVVPPELNIAPQTCAI